MKRLLILLLFLSTPAMAADLYMSTCSHVAWDTGCALNSDITHADCDTNAPTAGTAASNPLCPDPDGDNTSQLHEYLMDGTDTVQNPELATGETLYWCAGACDGSGSDTVTQEATITSADQGWTVTVYSGETVTIDGGADGSPGVGLDDHFQITSAAHGGWTYDGVAKNLKLLHFGGGSASNWFFLAPNADGITITNMELGYLGYLQTDVGVGDITSTPDGACGSAHGGSGYGVYLQDNGDNVSTFTFTNNLVHHVCKFALRCNNHHSSTAITYADNEFYNVGVVNNPFECSGLRIQRNVVWDYHDGIFVEDRTQNAIIEDNILECRGTYTMPGTECRTSIGVSDRDTPAQEGRMKNIIVRRNTVFSTMPNRTDDGNTSCGITVYGGCIDGTCSTTCTAGPQYGEACTVTADCECPANPEDLILVENNLIWNIRPNLTGPISSNSGCRGGMGISAFPGNPIMLRNNTIYRSHNPMTLDCDGGVCNFEVYNNLIVDAIDGVEPTPNPDVGLYIYANAASSVFNNNNVRANPSSGNAVDYRSGADFTCAGIGSWGTANACDATVFVNTGGTPDTWDLHLDATDTSNIDAGDCSSGPTEDFDQGARAATCDIGADERTAAASPTLEGGSLSGASIAALREWSCEMRARTGVGACF